MCIITRADVAALAQAYLAKSENAVGGNLHIVLHDGNLEDHNVRYCAEHAEKEGDADGVALAKAIMQLSMTQRKKLYKNGWSCDAKKS